MDDKAKELRYKAASKYLSAENYEEAIRKLQELPPDYQDVAEKLVSTFYQLGEQQFQKEIYTQAIASFQEVQKLNPDYPNVIERIKDAQRKAHEKTKPIKSGSRLSKNGMIPIIGGVLVSFLLVMVAIIFVFFAKGDEPPPTATEVASIFTATPPLTASSPTTAPNIPTFTPPPQTPTHATTTEPASIPTSEIVTQISTDTPTSEPTLTSIPEVINQTTTEPTEPPTLELLPTPTPEPIDTPASSAPPPAATPACPPSGLSGKIAVPVFKDSMYNIYLATADALWTPKLLFEQASQPAFLKNGQGMVLRSWEHPDWGQQLIYLPNFGDITAFRKMTEFVEDAHPSLNQNDELVFHSRQQDPKKDPIIIKMGTFPGSTPQKLPDDGANPDWLADGRIIFYTSFPQPGLYVMNGNGSDRKLILSTGKVVPAAAPVGDQVAVSLNPNGRWQIYMFSMKQGEGSLIPLTQSDADSYLPTWSPDGQYIAFSSNRDNNWAVWVMRTDGSEQCKLFDLPGSIDGKISAVNINSNLSFGWLEERMSWAP